VASEAGVWSADVCASDLPYICSPERATELGRPLLSFALSGLGSIVGAFAVGPHYAALRGSPLATICRAAGAGLVDSAKASSACLQRSVTETREHYRPDYYVPYFMAIVVCR